MALLLLLLCILLLVVLITYFKINAFLAFLVVSFIAGAVFGMVPSAISTSITKGLGDTLGSLTIVIILGAMLGKLVVSSGAAQQIATSLKNIFGAKHMVWAMSLIGFIIGIPLYYNVGFVLMMPIIFSAAEVYNLPLVYVGLPALASLSVMHGFLPPHPSPVALISQFHANMATTFLYGLCIAIPAIIIAGPLFARSLKTIPVNTSDNKLLSGHIHRSEDLPGIANSLISCLLPVLIIMSGVLASRFTPPGSAIANIFEFISRPDTAMLITIILVTYILGIARNTSLKDVMSLYAEAVKDITMILLIIGASGALKQIFIDSRLSHELANILVSNPCPPLILAWIITAFLRLCLGSATIAGLTAAGIIFPLLSRFHVDSNLLVLVIGAGSLFGSHINDSAFWLYKEYFGLSMKNTFLSWTAMESLVSIVGLVGVLTINQFIK